MIRLCVFDLDGTLSNTLRSLHYFCNEALKQCNFPTVDDIHKIQYMVGNGVHTLLERLLTESIGNYTQEQYDLLFATYGELYRADPLYLVKEYDGTRELLTELHRRGVKLAVLSNKPDALTKRVAAALYPEIPFDLCRGQIDGFPKKPAPDGLWKVLETLTISKEETLYIGDSDVDMKTGTRAGVRTIGVTWGFRTAEELRASGAVDLIDHPNELLSFLK